MLLHTLSLAFLLCLQLFESTAGGQPEMQEMTRGYFAHFKCVLQCCYDVYLPKYLAGNLCNATFTMIPKGPKKPDADVYAMRLMTCIIVHCRAVIPDQVCPSGPNQQKDSNPPSNTNPQGYNNSGPQSSSQSSSTDCPTESTSSGSSTDTSCPDADDDNNDDGRGSGDDDGDDCDYDDDCDCDYDDDCDCDDCDGDDCGGDDCGGDDDGGDDCDGDDDDDGCDDNDDDCNCGDNDGGYDGGDDCPSSTTTSTTSPQNVPVAVPSTTPGTSGNSALSTTPNGNQVPPGYYQQNYDNPPNYQPANWKDQQNPQPNRQLNSNSYNKKDQQTHLYINNEQSQGTNPYNNQNYGSNNYRTPLINSWIPNMPLPLINPPIKLVSYGPSNDQQRMNNSQANNVHVQTANNNAQNYQPANTNKYVEITKQQQVIDERLLRLLKNRPWDTSSSENKFINLDQSKSTNKQSNNWQPTGPLVPKPNPWLEKSRLESKVGTGLGESLYGIPRINTGDPQLVVGSQKQGQVWSGLGQPPQKYPAYSDQSYNQEYGSASGSNAYSWSKA